MSPSDSTLLRKRSSASSGISPDTIGSVPEQCTGASTSSSPVPPPPLPLPLNLHQPQRTIADRLLQKSTESTTLPAAPVLIEIDDEAQPRWNFLPYPWSKHFSNSTNHHHRTQSQVPNALNHNSNNKESMRRNHEETTIDYVTNSHFSYLVLSVAEDLSNKSNSRHSPPSEMSYALTDASCFRTTSGLVITTPPILTPTHRHERRKRKTRLTLN